MNPKIATCCYCGTRAALVLRGETRHELSCARCGAPLHELKMLRVDRAQPTDRKPERVKRAASPVQYRRKPRKRRKGKALGRRALEEIWDVIEDIFD